MAEENTLPPLPDLLVRTENVVGIFGGSMCVTVDRADIRALVAHVRALQEDNERLRADLQQSRVAIDTYVAALAASRREG